MKEILGVIGAVVATIVVLGTPILSFVSFIHNWNGFIKLSLLIGSAVDFLFVLNIFMQEVEDSNE